MLSVREDDLYCVHGCVLVFEFEFEFCVDFLVYGFNGCFGEGCEVSCVVEYCFWCHLMSPYLMFSSSVTMRCAVSGVMLASAVFASILMISPLDSFSLYVVMLSPVSDMKTQDP